MWRREISSKPLEEVLTQRATQVLDLARQKAIEDSRETASADHIMQGLIRLNAGVGVHALRTMGVSLEELDQCIARSSNEEPTGTSQAAPFDSQAQEAIRLARLEASELGHRYVGTEHLVLGLLRESQSATAVKLHSLDIDTPGLRRHIIGALRGPRPEHWT
ncbi:hypothetical protein E1267_26400 [Nonomuraea longispora]|uniref:Clp R domain-containing protein n=1 Tax=Nonomuraea longispora TaxID=1848320 RepID=A0A4R4NA22_9ACTN|nr:hypothetical protein E1267_26400 [Nonomuraea longispora]